MVVPSISWRRPVNCSPRTPLVHATKNSYTVTVTATDPFRASDTITVTINVTANVPPRQPRSDGGGRGDRGRPRRQRRAPQADEA